MAKLKLTWEEFKDLAYKSLKEYTRQELPDPPIFEFVKDRSHEGEGICYELPDYVYVDLINKT